MTTTSYRLDDFACDADGLSVFDQLRYRRQDDAVIGAWCRRRSIGARAELKCLC
jgi:hypothetical protein